MIVTLIDGKTAELWRDPSNQAVYSEFRTKVIRNGFLIGNGYNNARAIADANARIKKVNNR